MLSRTADHLYWMSRYIERAESTARLLDVTWQMSMVPQSAESANQNWHAVILLNSLEDAFFAKYKQATAANVLHFMISDAENPSSIHACLRMCRENAHAVRGTITSDMWETLNATWLDLESHRFDASISSGPGEFFEWVKLRSSLVRGATLGTMLQDEAFHFIRLGTVLERADNTARILDVKYHVLTPGPDQGTTDFYQWGALLRSVSAFEVYRKTYRAGISPARVAELLILHPGMPRSLMFCMRALVKSLGLVANSHSGETQRRAGQLYSELRYGRIEDIFARGLHVFLTDFMRRIEGLGNGIQHDFLEAMQTT
ncbi:alpha-E domain-containing protein [Nitrogeniibacter mangrovi]|uniref:Alpha-E domain-containing protein n=1 Tax=Nitrogeniibacter mangrovi TaxID=2016596 RepID=A0A6C1B3F8_9RHOO|nr:alpha-E domain-containing protein [Nitrogeniibacter mangrovi]QID18087.1 alpha-E domain-containing protein [Nitrogeniibacter mangrovi]